MSVLVRDLEIGRGWWDPPDKRLGAFWNLKRAFDLWILTYSGSKLELLETHHEVGTLCPSGTLHPRLSAASPHLVSSRLNSHWTVLSAWDPPDCEAAPVTEYKITSPVPRTLRRSQGAHGYVRPYPPVLFSRLNVDLCICIGGDHGDCAGGDGGF